MLSPRTTGILRWLVPALLLAAAPGALAVEYVVTPRVDQRISYDDNIQLRNDGAAVNSEVEDQRDAYMYRIAPSVSLRARGDAWEVNSTAGIEFERFDPDAFNTDNQRLETSIRRFSERQLFQFDGTLRRQAQRTAEIDASGLLEATRVEDVTLRPSYQRQLSERMQLTVGASYNNRHFDTLQLQDFLNIGLDVTFARQINDTTTVDLAIFGQEFETETRPGESCTFGIFPVGGTFIIGEQCAFFGSRRESTTLGAQVGLRKALTSQLEFSVSAGVRDVETRSVLDDILVNCIFDFGGDLVGACEPQSDSTSQDTSSGLIARSSITYRGDRYTYSASIERSVAPVGLGFLIETDRADATFQYEFSPRMRGSVRGVFLDSDSVTEGAPFDRRYMSLDLRMDWRIRENWRLSPGLRWRDQVADVFNQEADSLTAFVNLVYRPQPTLFSR